MKILAALKKIKHLTRKIESHSKRISKWCSYVVDDRNDDDPTYNEDDLIRMRQQIMDWSTQMATIRHALHVTNIRTVVDWNGHKNISIDELLLIQNLILPMKVKQQQLLRRAEKSSGYGNNYSKDAYVVMQYDPKARDKDLDKLEREKESLDEILDNLNIETDVVGIE
jgi:hypothetical protein